METEYMELLKALELACEWISNDHVGTIESWKEYFRQRAKEAIS